MTGERPFLPLADEPAAERADAARNRQVLLATARTILATEGIQALTLDRLAAAAGVGVGTVYRRFDDRAGLAYALLDSEERRFQQAFLSGPPPLGPGAPPADRLRAFVLGYLDRLELDADLRAMGEGKAPTFRYEVGAYRTDRIHLVTLLSQLTSPGEAGFLADLLLGALGAGFFLHERRERSRSLAEIKQDFAALLHRLGLDAQTQPGSA